MAQKPHIVALCSPNQSRLEHVRKLHALRHQYEITCCRIGPGMGWERFFVDHDVEIPETARSCAASRATQLLGAIRRPDAIINFSEAYVPLHSQLCTHYGLIGPDPAAVRIGRNKLHMRRFCREIGIPVPEFSTATRGSLDGCRSLGYPAVVKPAIGCSSTLVQRVENYDDLLRKFPDILQTANRVYENELLFGATVGEYGEFPFVVEELIGGSVQFPTRMPYPIGEISVESIAFRGRTVILAIHDAPIASNGPYYEKIVNCTPTRIPPSLIEKATEYVERIHAKLGAGAYVLHTEMRTFADDLMLLEFGVRIGGSSLYRSVLHSTGNDLVQILIQLALGEDPPLVTAPARPTLIQYFVPSTSGRIRAISGTSKIPTSPYYVDHQLYDDVADQVQRPPLRMRASGYFALQADNFDVLEQEAMRLLKQIEIEVLPLAG